jgi:hypothetical protein
MINWFIDNGVGISVGIISDSFSGQDPVIYNALKRCVAQGMDKCTIWNHGTDAAYHYGEAASVAEAQQKVQACDTKIKTIFPGYQPFLMVPHENSWGPYLLQALRNIGYKVISASTEDYSGMTWDLTTNPMQMPQQATTGDWDDNKNDFVGVPVSRTVADCEAAAASGEVCVIMTHPHEFANGAYSLTTLAQLVQSLKAAGFTSTNFYTVMNEQLGVHSNPTVMPTKTPTKAPVPAPTRFPTRVPTTKTPVAPVSTSVPTRAPVAATSVPTKSPVATSVPTKSPVAATSVPTKAPVVVSTPSTAPTKQPVVPSIAPTNSPITVSTSVPTKPPVATTQPVAVSTNQPVAVPTVVPTKQPTVLTAAPTNQPVVKSTSVPTESPSAKSITQLQYSANIRVKSSSTYQYQWLNVLETIRKLEQNHNLIDLQYSGITNVVSSSEFDISIKMTYGLNPESNPQFTFFTTAILLSASIYFDTFDNYYHTLGTDKKTTFTRVTYQGDASLNYEVNDRDIKAHSHNNKHGLFSFEMNAANISILATVCFCIIACFVAVGYFVYRRCYNNSDDERKRVYSISTTGSNEEMLSPSELFVEIELNGHYSLPLSDNSDFVEDACIHRHGLKLPDQLENV